MGKQVLTSAPEHLSSAVEVEVEEQRHAFEPGQVKTIIVRPELVGALIPL